MITREKHEKHPPLKKPSIGFYHRNEWAIYGSKCDKIKSFYQQLSEVLSPSFRLGYVDADHGIENSYSNLQIGIKHFYHEAPVKWNEYDDKFGTLHFDGVIVNGNHYPAARQIVIIDKEKKDSLYRRVDQLNDIRILVLSKNESEIFDFLRSRINPETKILRITEINKIAEVIRDSIESNIPELKALILAGGKSKRMGKDKSLISYHDKPQQIHLAEMCRSLNFKTFISKAADYSENNIQGFPVIRDRLIDMGPFGAIISAMMFDPDAAWLVVACDLPFLNKTFLQRLIKQRDARLLATAAIGKQKDFPEPLVTIYEPDIYLRMLKFMALGYSCPRKVLINSDIKLVEIDQERIIENVNTLKESDAALDLIKNKH